MEKISYPDSIEKFFNSVVEKIKTEFNPEYIIVAGSFGKGSWLFEKDKLLSDFEFVFVCKKLWSIKKKKKLLLKLNSEYPFDIYLKGYFLKKIQKKIFSNYSFKNPGYIPLSFFDTFSNPQIIYSSSDATNDLLKLMLEEIPVWEAWRLMINRQGDLLNMTVNKNNFDDVQENYCWLKAFESCADAYLIINKLYNKNIATRYNSLVSSGLETDAELNVTCRNSFNILISALYARKEHSLTLFNISHLSQKERNEIIDNWMKLIQDKMFEYENISSLYEYLNNKNHQYKYLETNMIWKIGVSNIIRLVYNPLLINIKFYYYNFNDSWRHIILLTVLSTFNEYSQNNLSFPHSKIILGKILKKRFIIDLQGKEFISEVVKYWKILR